MRKHLVNSVIAIVVILVFSSQLIAQAPSFDPRDLTGDWNLVSRIQTFGNVPGSRGENPVEPPLTAEGKANLENNKPGYGPRAIPPAFGNDPMGMCDPLGIPRNIVTGWAPIHDWIEIANLPNRAVFFIEWHHDWREVWTDGRQLPAIAEIEPKWNGYSVGRWDGNTFVVDTVGLDPRTWVDKFGYPHSEEARLQERWRRVDAETLELTLTLTDPVNYTQPWHSDTKVFKLNREKGKEWDQQIYCAPSEEFYFNQKVRDGAGGKK